MICRICGKSSVGNERCLFCGAKRYDRAGGGVVADNVIRQTSVFCVNCGTEIKNGEKFCMNCGAPAPERRAAVGDGTAVYGSGVGGSQYEAAAAQQQREKEELAKAKENKNKSLAKGAMFLAIVLAVCGLISIVFTLCHLERIWVIYEGTEEFVRKTVVNDDNVGSIIDYVAGITAFIPALVTAIVATVRAKSNKYDSLKLSVAALCVTLVGAGLALGGGLGNLFNQIHWSNNYEIVSDDAYAFNRLLDEDDKLSDYVYDHYKDILIGNDNAENIKAYVNFKHYSDWWNDGMYIDKPINFFDYDNGDLYGGYNRYYYWDYERILLNEVDMMYTVNDNGKCTVKFKRLEYDNGHGECTSDILTDNFVGSSKYTAGLFRAFEYDKDVNTSNAAFADKLYAFCDYSDDDIKAFNIEIGESNGYINVNTLGTKKADKSDRKDIYSDVVSFDAQEYITNYIDKHYENYAEENYSAWETEFKNNYHYSWYDTFDEYYESNKYIYMERFYNEIYGEMNSSESEHKVDIEILEDMLDKKIENDNYSKYVSLYSSRWIYMDFLIGPLNN